MKINWTEVSYKILEYIHFGLQYAIGIFMLYMGIYGWLMLLKLLLNLIPFSFLGV